MKLEESAEYKSEYIDGEIIPMVGETKYCDRIESIEEIMQVTERRYYTQRVNT